MTRKTRKSKARKIKTRKRNKSKINKSKKYFGGHVSDAHQQQNILRTNPVQVADASKSVNNIVRSASDTAVQAATAAEQTVNDGLNAADQLTTAASEGAHKAITSVSDGLNDVGNAVSDLGNAASVGLRKNRDDLLAKLNEQKSQIKDVHENVKNNLTVKGLPHDIEELKQKYETSKDDVDIRNSLELENALKLHEQIEQILKNPLIENLVDSSNEHVNELLTSGMKMFGNAVTSAGESIPLLGEAVVLENMFRHFLYNISDGSEAATEIEKNINQISNILGDIGKVKDAAKQDATNVSLESSKTQTGGAIQHRINTSINDFLKSSKLIKW